MSNIVIKAENLSKQYRLGEVGTGTLSQDLNRWWYKVRGKEDPFLKIGDVNDRTKMGGSEFVWALKDVNFQIEKGDVVGIIGRNGAGKSTLLKILSKTTLPTTGTIKVYGRIASLLEVGTGFHPELTGRDNIFLNGAILGMTRREIKAKFDEIVSFAGVERYVDTPVKRYSSGMYVRLAFAVAAFLEPDILVVDEVLAVGDADFQKKAIGKMQDVSTSEGRTVLFVSHNMASIKSLCKTGFLMQNGALHQSGEMNDIIDAYLENTFSERDTYFLRSENEFPTAKTVWIRKACVRKGGIQVGAICSGDEFEFSVEYQASKLGERCRLYIGVYDRNSTKLLHIGTEYSTVDYFVSKRMGLVTCRIPKCSLLEGNYSINISLQVNGQTGYDRIIDAFALTVENGDFYRNGKLPELRESTFLIDQEWKVS